MAKSKDIYSNKAYGTVTESAANTLTFSEIRTNVSIFEKVAWIINRIEWYAPTATLQALTTNQDSIKMALTASQNITSLSLSNPSVIDLFDLYLKVVGAAATSMWSKMPFVREFSSLPGGGIIVAPRPLFVAAQGDNLAAGVQVECRFSFQEPSWSICGPNNRRFGLAWY